MIDKKLLASMLADDRGGHSAFQIDNYIVSRAGGTTFGMYKQAVREMRARWQALGALYIELASMRRRVRWGWLRSSLTRARDAIQLDGLERQIGDTEREFRRFYDHAEKLKAQIGEMTPQRVEALEAEHWMHKLKAQCAIDLLVNDKLSASSIEHLMALRKEDRGELFEVLASGRAKAHLLAWLHEYEPEVDIDRSTLAIPEGGLGRALHALGNS